jgi:hypothetical protein
MVTLRFHLHANSARDACWWVDSPDVPSLFATSPRLVNCRQLALNVLESAHVDLDSVECVLAASGA